MRISMFIFLLVSMLVVSSGAVLAQCGGRTDKRGVSEEGIVNAFCPVLGGKVEQDTPYTVEYSGKTIGFCCAACMDRFKANPEKYLDKLKVKDEE